MSPVRTHLYRRLARLAAVAVPSHDRDSLALKISNFLESATFGSGQDNRANAQDEGDGTAKKLIREANAILDRANNLAGDE